MKSAPGWRQATAPRWRWCRPGTTLLPIRTRSPTASRRRSPPCLSAPRSCSRRTACRRASSTKAIRIRSSCGGQPRPSPSAAASRAGGSAGRARAVHPSRGSSPTSARSSTRSPPSTRTTVSSCARPGSRPTTWRSSTTSTSRRAPAPATWVSPSPARSHSTTTRVCAKRWRAPCSNVSELNRTVVVVGAGIAGLATAWYLQQRGVNAVVLDAGDRVGGKVRTSELDGVPLDVGPDTFLGRVPWAVDLCRDLGLESDLVAPATSRAWLWSRGELRPLPDGLALGVPLDPAALARSGLISPEGVARAALDVVLPQLKPRADPSVADVIGGRLGQEVLERLVDPLIGGINAGRSDRLSLAAVAPDLFAAFRRHRSLILGLRAERGLGFGRTRRTEVEAPLFLGLRGGMERLTSTLAAKLDVSLSAPVDAVVRSEDGRLAVAVRDGEPLEADHVVLAVPASAAAPMLRGAAAKAA